MLASEVVEMVRVGYSRATGFPIPVFAADFRPPLFALRTIGLSTEEELPIIFGTIFEQQDLAKWL